MSRLAGWLGAAALAAYAWWASGLRPFARGAYIAIAVPVTGLAILALLDHIPGGGSTRTARRDDPLRDDPLRDDPLRSEPPRPDRPPRPDGPAFHAVLPWLVLFAVAVALESLALALGGRSAAVPTLSTVVDRALVWHLARFGLLCLWLAAACLPARRVVARIHVREV